MTEPRKPGRPRAENPKSVTRSVRFTEDELAEVQGAADDDNGTPVTRWIAEAALEKARGKRS